MSANLEIVRYYGRVGILDEHISHLKALLLEKMLKSSNNPTVRIGNTELPKEECSLFDSKNIYGLSGAWEPGEASHHTNVDATGIYRKIIGSFQKDDVIIVLGCCSLISSQEYPDKFGSVPNSKDNILMSSSASDVIKQSNTTIELVNNKSEKWMVSKINGDESGGFDRIDFEPQKFKLEPNVWQHFAKGTELFGAYASLSCTFSIPSPGEYTLLIKNQSPLFGGAPGTLFNMEVEYNFTVT
jgi:hypothetical protein